MRSHLVKAAYRLGKSQRRAVALGWFTIAVVTLASPSYAQERDAKVLIEPRPSVRAETRAGVIRVDVDRVFVPVTVTDSRGRTVSGLHSDDFRLLQDGVLQQLSEFFVQDGPVSIGVAFDASNSMRSKLDECRQAVSEFLRMSSHDDEALLVTFQDQPEFEQGFTSNIDEIDKDLAAIQPRGWTALYDAMYLAINHMKEARYPRKVLLVLSDGGDNNSRYNYEEIRDLVREADVRTFAISVQGKSPLLDRLAAESGGRGYRIGNLDELPRVMAALSAEIHSEYVLGFSPPARARDGKYHTVKVEFSPPAVDPSLHLSWRHGYYSANE